MCKEKLSIEVSIGDASKAIVALRTYGLTEQKATNILAHETDTAIIEHGIIPKQSIAPFLIELFGEQHIEDALSYAYLFLSDYDTLDFDLLYDILLKLMEVYPPEELICSPEKIRSFIDSLNSQALFNMVSEIVSSEQEEYFKSEYDCKKSILEDLSSRQILKMANDTDEYDDE